MNDFKDAIEQIIEDAVDSIIDGSNDSIQNISEVDMLIDGINKQFGTNYVLTTIDRKRVIEAIDKEWG